MLFCNKLMTTGNRIVDTRVLTQSTYNGGPSSSLPCGSYKAKTWSGADSPKSAKPPLGPKRYYTVLDSRTSRPIVKWFRDKPLKRLTKKQPNNYSMTAVTDVQPVGTIVAQALRWSDNALLAEDTYGNVPPTHFLSGGWPSFAGVPPPFDANDDIKLINKLKEQIRGQDFNLGVFLGEGHQTLRLIGDSAVKLARSYRSFRRGDLAGAITHLRTSRPNLKAKQRTLAGSNWLELQYGWMPLLKDVHEGAKALAHILHAPFIQRYSASISKKIDKFSWPVGSKIIYSTAVGISRKRIIAMVSEQESVPQLLGLLDPELVAWELIPFSFVADWVAPIGPYLEARAFASRLKGTFITTTTSRRILSGPMGQDWNQGSYRWSYQPSFSGTEYNSFSMDRTVSTILDVPMPVVKPVEKILSLGHCLNGLALLSTIVTGGKVSASQGKLMGFR